MGRPGGPVPDLDVVVDARHDDVLPDSGVLGEVLRQEHATLAVELGHGRSGEDVALHLPRLTAERVQLCDPGHVLVPGVARVDVDVPLDPAGKDDAARQRMPKARRQREPVLLVEGVLVLAVEHSGPVSVGSVSATMPHITPLSSTPQPNSPIRVRNEEGPSPGPLECSLGAVAQIATATLLGGALSYTGPYPSIRPTGAPRASPARCIQTGIFGSRTSSKWCFAITASRNGFGIPLRLVLPSAASVYIVASSCSNWSAGRTSVQKRAGASPLFQKRCAVPGSTTTVSPGPAMIVLPPALNPTSPSSISKTSVWYGWMWAAATKPSGSTRTSTRTYSPSVSLAERTT